MSLQVWKYPKVWEGFVKCCQRTKPQSYSVLLQLPPAQLTSVFERCPEMREPLLQHVHSFTPHQVRNCLQDQSTSFTVLSSDFMMYQLFLFFCVTASSHPGLHHVGPGGREKTRTETCGAGRGERGN